MSWLSVRVRPGASPEAALAALFEMGSEGVQESGAELLTHFPGDTDADAIVAAVKHADARADVSTSIVPAIDWAQEWKKGVGAHELGALAIVPP